MVTWEAVQKESYLSQLERSRRDSEAEVLRRTAHRCQADRRLGRSRAPRAVRLPWSVAPALRMSWDAEAGERRGLWGDLEGPAPAS